jgi:hypothetical protein
MKMFDMLICQLIHQKKMNCFKSANKNTMLDGQVMAFESKDNLLSNKLFIWKEFSFERNEWNDANVHAESSFGKQHQLRIGTMNVLGHVPGLVGSMILRSDERYNFIVDNVLDICFPSGLKFAAHPPLHVVCFNEPIHCLTQSS